MPKALCCCEDKSKKAVLFCAANMYIIDGFLSSWIKTNVETYTIVLASRIGVSDGLYEKYQDIANSSTRIQLFWIDTFEISFWRRAWSYDFSLLKESIRKQREYSQIFFQSGENFVSRYVLNYISKKHPNAVKTGLLLSIPPFLYRDLICIDKYIDSTSQLNKLLQKVKLHPNPNPKNKALNLKKGLLLAIETIIDQLFFVKTSRLTKLVRVSSYFNKQALDRHIVSDEYWGLWIRDIYGEPVEIHPCSQKKQLRSTYKSESAAHQRLSNSLVLLGPTSKSMISEYKVDVKSLLSQIKIQDIIIRPHPRFIDLAEELINDFLDDKDMADYKIEIGGVPTGAHMILLGYFSSFFFEVEEKNLTLIISDSATLNRFPLTEIDLLTGSAFRKSPAFTRLSKDRKWYCPMTQPS